MTLYDDYDAPPYIHVDGALVAHAEAAVSPLDHGLVDANGLVEASFVKAIVSRGASPAPSPDPRGLVPTCVVFGEPLMHMVDKEAERARLTLTDVYSADEVFLTSTAGGVIPVGAVDGRRPDHGPLGPVTRALRDAYERVLTDPAYTVGLRELLPEPGRRAS